MSTESRQKVIIDTSVLLNFLKIERLELLTEHPDYRFLMTEHVRREITEEYPEQIGSVEVAIDSGALEEIRVDDPAELEAFARLHATGRIGAGECSAIAVVANRNLALAIDDRRARTEAHRHLRSMGLMNTESIMLSLIRANVLDVTTADAIEQDWEEKHRFRLPFASFGDRLSE